MCFLSKTPQKKYKELQLCLGGCDWSVLEYEIATLPMLSPEFGVSLVTFSGGQNQKIRFEETE